MRTFLVSIWCLVFSAFAQVHAGDNLPRTNWGGVFKVPVEKIDEVDRATEKWANWIKETHPLGPDDENNLASLSITRSPPQAGYVYYVIVEIYPTPEGLMTCWLQLGCLQDHLAGTGRARPCHCSTLVA